MVIRLVGGPADGHTVRSDDGLGVLPHVVQWANGNVLDPPPLYRRERFWCRWPVPGWELRVAEDATLGDGGISDAAWGTVIYCCEDRRRLIEWWMRERSRLDTAMSMVELGLRERDDDLCSQGSLLAEEQVAELVKLTTGGNEAWARELPYLEAVGR